MNRARFGRVALMALVASGVLMALVSLPAPAIAASASFSTPSATSTWAKGVDFSEPVSLSTAATRAELLIASPFEAGATTVADIGPIHAGATTLRYSLSASEGALVPNTTLTARWRVTYADGRSDIGPSVMTTYADTRFPWKTLTGSLVHVHWYEGSDSFARQALSIAEESIARTAKLLGVTETKPVDFFIYADQSSFYDALGPGTRENVGGQANPEIRTLFALIPSGDGGALAADYVPHELTHLVFDTATANPYHYPPSWLNEGLAVYESLGYDPGNRNLVDQAVSGRTLMPLDALSGQFPTQGDRFALAYAESVSAIDFLIRTYGQSSLVKLVRSYAAGVSDDEALLQAVGTDVAGFQAAWLHDLGASEPSRYGPRSPAPGPLPAGWSGPGATGSLPSGAPAPSGSFAGGPSSGGTAGDAGTASDQLPVVAGIAAVLAIVLVGLSLLRRRLRGAP
jgi:hypothetical protein